MTTDRITLRHPDTGGVFDAPESAVPIHEAAGWVRATPETGEDSPRRSPAGKATSKDGDK